MKPILWFSSLKKVQTQIHINHDYSKYISVIPIPPNNEENEKKKSKKFSLSCCVILLYLQCPRAHIAVLMGLYYVTFWLNRFLANNNNLPFFFGHSLWRENLTFCFRVFFTTFQRIFSSQHRQIVIGIVQRYYVVWIFSPKFFFFDSYKSKELCDTHEETNWV